MAEGKKKKSSKKKSNGNGNNKRWIQDANIKEGAFRAKVPKGSTVHSYAEKVKRDYKKDKTHTAAELKTYRQANLALVFQGIARRNKKSKK